MTYIVRNIDVLDTKPSTGVGIALPFNGPTGINTTYTTRDAIKSNLLNCAIPIAAVTSLIL